MSRRHHTISATWVLCIVVPIVAVATWISADYSSRHRALEAYRSSIAACHRGNALRAQLNSSIEELRFSPLPLTNCSTAYQRP